MNQNFLRMEDLVNNPTPRVPVCLCLDTSASMCDDPIRELNQGVKLFYDAIREDEVALYSAEICIVAFGGEEPRCIRDFSSLELQPDAPELTAEGRTPMGEGVLLALDLLERRKKEYQRMGVDYYQPWLVLMTDGAPNGDITTLRSAVSRTAGLVNQRKLSVFPIAIGGAADMNVLAHFSPKREPMRLQGLKFREFFEWLSKSVSQTSQSLPGETVDIDQNGIQSWLQL